MNNMNDGQNSQSITVLIYGLQFGDNSVGGIYLANLYTIFANDNLATINGQSMSSNKIKSKYHYRIGSSEYVSRLGYFRNGKSVGSRKYSLLEEGKEESCSNSRIELECKARIPKNRLVKMVARSIGTQFVSKVVMSKILLSYLEEIQPDILYGVASDYRSTKLLLMLKMHLKVPLILHVMDDWPKTMYSEGIEKLTIRKKYAKLYQELIEKSDVVIGICKDMAQEYQQRYKRIVLSYPIPVALEEYRKVFRSKWSAGEPFTIRYGGRIGWAIRQSLEDVSYAVYQLCKQGYNIVFEIATNQVDKVPSVCNDLDCVSVSKLAPLEELPRIASECDLHLICYDFDSVSVKQARFSMPGKLPACMASGTPILVYSPPSLPVVKYAHKHQWGSLVTVRDKKTLVDKIRELIENESLREALGTKAREIAFARHDAKVVSAEFREMMADLVEKHRQSKGSLNEN